MTLLNFAAKYKGFVHDRVEFGHDPVGHLTMLVGRSSTH